ncbi:MAG TPA: site-specific integrase [Gaiellales bacterium]|nr:site-specific integrase [Gaiellales bacterium]
MLKIDPVKVKRRVKPWLRPRELDRLAAVARNDHQAFELWFFAWTGARVGEASQVRLRDVDLTGSGRITIAGIKTDAAVRTIPLHPELRPLLIRHIERMQAGGFGATTPILHTGHGTPLKQQQIGCWLAEMGERAGVGRVNAQMLRRSYGSNLLNKGLRVEVVSKLMGHANVRVTMESYAELLPSQLEAEFFAICR